ncbi:hypothetical protein EIN_045210 [Entamoeba invadens IP1]|uniref:Uncharacterized protein n=1 Tax=Entamoeba invadens IP1 TaxID=370355 RepID=A0A0A1U4U8_ENTIV|nr:hypothetical protein EIN_045210 [Entamoeba invadens IP1]ELP89297.1 hypothetical protein EIN_045210 [Entamoeba invadens IP1]|eukprot:XP_004256068.1 hypothetical protein EIN_045210 [Entamoeba invadens IP1]
MLTILLVLVSIASARYMVKYDDGEIAIKKFGKCYQSTFNYVKYELNAMYVYTYTSSDCNNWIPSSSQVATEGVIKYNLPDYVAVQYTYNGKSCSISNEDGNPRETLYSGECIRGSKESEQFAIDGKNLVLKTFGNSDCTGSHKDMETIAELDKCVDKSTYSYKITSGAFEVFALLALALAFLF